MIVQKLILFALLFVLVLSQSFDTHAKGSVDLQKVANAELEQGIKAYEAGDYQTATSILLPLAIAGVSEAQYRLHVMLMKGQGFKKNYCFAIIWADKAARQNHPQAAIMMSFAYIGGWLVKTDYELAYRWAFHGERLGHPNGKDHRESTGLHLSPEKLKEINSDMDSWEATQQPPAEIFPFPDDQFTSTELNHIRLKLREKYNLGGC